MKYVMALTVAALVGCAGSKNQPPPQEPVSTTQTTSSSPMTLSQGEPVTVDASPAPVIATKEADRNLATRVRAHLARDKALQGVNWQRVTMEVEDGHLTLTGILPSLADSSEMERAAREVKGVHGVTNEIRVNENH